ncbi:hypothetical protein JL998_02550 [Staphylococcus pseudintermedius]|nr:hypothetical protein [Staphylococcus pseudintermedius]
MFEIPVSDLWSEGEALLSEIPEDEDLYLFMGYKDDETAIFNDHRNQEKFEVKVEEIKNKMQGIENDAVNIFIQLPKR